MSSRTLLLPCVFASVLLGAVDPVQSGRSQRGAPPPPQTEAQPLTAVSLACAVSVRDQAAPGFCLGASSVPTPGVLFPGPHLGGVNNLQSGTNSFVGGGSNNTAGLGGTLLGHTTVGGGGTNDARGDYATIGGGRNNNATGQHSFIGGGSFNLATDGNGNGHSTIGGGGDNTASGGFSVVAGGHFNEATGSASTIGGGESNDASQAESTVGGGFSNNAFGIRSTVGGGTGNRAVGEASFVGGGVGNFAVGTCSTVGGGQNNLANFPIFTGNSHGTAGGGRDNGASGSYATVGGGGGEFLGNAAAGLAATVPGGQANAASADFSFAAGRRAKAEHTGSFVWGDAQDADKTSSADDEFNVYASGGTRIFSSAGAASGVLLAPGGGSWSSVSDRAAKENVEEVETGTVLERVCALPVTTWNYKTQDDSVRHMGVMAQDFHAAFGLGTSERTIDTVDVDGVALAAIQGLNELVAEQRAEISALRERIAALEDLVSDRGDTAAPADR